MYWWHNQAMPHVTDLLQSGSRIPFTLLAGPADAAPLAFVTAVETLDGLQRAPSGALVVITGRALSRAADYEVDIAIRTAAERDLPALVLIGGGRLPVTATRLAGRAALAVLSAPDDCDVADVVLHLDQVIRGGAADSLARAQAALRMIRETGPGASEAKLLDSVGTALGRNVWLSDDEEGEPIWIAGRRHGSVTGPPDDAVRLVLPALAAAVGRLKGIALEHAIAPGQTRSDMLTELIVAERDRAGMLADRARVLGFAVDDLHTVIWMTPERPAGADPAELAERRRLFDTLTTYAHQVSTEAWNLAKLADDIVVVGTARTEIRVSAARQMITSMHAAVTAEHAGMVLRSGIGTSQRGIDGLRQSAMEARAAAAIAARSGQLIRVFDVTGINRILAGIAGSPLSRRVVDDLLGPLDALGPARSTEAIKTLCAYLDTRGSLKAAAARLRLHPNAVNYRIKKVTQQLRVDLADPDIGFALHLACRVRLRD